MNARQLDWYNRSKETLVLRLLTQKAVRRISMTDFNSSSRAFIVCWIQSPVCTISQAENVLQINMFSKIPAKLQTTLQQSCWGPSSEY